MWNENKIGSDKKFLHSYSLKNKYAHIRVHYVIFRMINKNDARKQMGNDIE